MPDAPRIATIDDVRAAQRVIDAHLSPAPLVRSYPLERELGFGPDRRVWIKDFGSTPVGSFKLLGALNWMSQNLDRIGDKPVVGHSSGNFASGLSFAGSRFGKRVIIVMPETAPQVKMSLTKLFGAEIRTYDIATDHLTGARDRMTREISEELQAVQASPYDDADVIAGNGVGALEIVQDLKRAGRTVSHFVCQVSGGGLMAGQALAIADGFPDAQLIAVEPDGAADFQASLAADERVRLDRPTSICDGLLSYDVGAHNWPILQRLTSRAVAIPDHQTCAAMAWLYQHHGWRTEPSGAITTAAVLQNSFDLNGTGDVVIVLSGRNVDEDRFRDWISP